LLPRDEPVAWAKFFDRMPSPIGWRCGRRACPPWGGEAVAGRRTAANDAKCDSHEMKYDGRAESDLIQELIDTTALRRGKSSNECALRQRAVEAVLTGTHWLRATEVGTLRDPTSRNRAAAPSRWLEQRRAFAIKRRGLRLFPAYEFDEAGEPVDSLRAVLEVFAGFAAFRIAAWFESDNGYLGAKPREALATRGVDVLAAARRHVAGPAHG
jgi:hypothetical protein